MRRHARCGTLVLLLLACLPLIAPPAVANVVSGADVEAVPPAPIALEDGTYRSIAGAASIVRDPELDLTADRVLALYRDGRLERVRTPYLNMLPTEGRYWGVFPFENVSGEPGQWIVDLRRPHLLELEVHVDRGRGARPLVTLPRNAALAERPIVNRYHGFALDLAAGEVATVVVGYRSFETGWLAPHVGSAEAVLRAHASEDALNWLVNGVLIAMIAFVLVMVPVIGWRVGLAFAAYLGAGLFFVAHADNYLAALLAPATRLPVDTFGLLSGLLVTLTALVLARTLFETHRTQPGPDRVYRCLFLLLCVAIVLLPVAYGIPPYHSAAYSIILATSLAHPVIGVLALRQGQVGARPFLVGSPLIVGSLVYAALAHLVPGRFSIERTLDVGQITLLVEAFAFALAILVRTTRLRSERDEAVNEAMAAANARLLLLEALGDSERRFETTTAEAEAARSRLATISHDIRQPLLSLRATLERLEDVPDTADRRMREAFAYMERVARNADRPADEDAQSEAAETFDLAIVLENATGMFRHEAEERGIALTCEPSDLRVTASAVPLLRMVNNLVANAVRHSGGRTVRLRAHGDGAFAQLEVIDDGRGMGTETLSAVQRSGVKGADSEGDGLGLAIVRELAAREGIAFELQSRSGHGTLARLTLPLASQPDARPGPSSIARPDDAHAGQRSSARSNG